MRTNILQRHRQIKFHVRTGDFVRVIAGDYKGIEGAISNVDRKRLLVKVDGVPKLKKMVRPSQANPQGGSVEIDRAIHISNVRKVNLATKGQDSSVAKKAAKKTATKKKKTL